MDKKCWIKRIYSTYEEDNNTPIDISWSSSSSDSDIESKRICRLKKMCRSTNVNWIKPPLTEIILEDCANSPEESPIISSYPVQEMSPVLTQYTVNETTESSPVIGKKRILKKIRKKFKNTYKINSSPDIFETQSTLVIESNSPDCFSFSRDISRKSQECGEISPPSSLEIAGISSQVTVESIQSFPSPNHCLSQLTRYKSDNGDNVLYHQPITKRKRFKKKGLAAQLQKVLKLQKTMTSIWKHEVYMNKFSEVVDTFEFVILNIQKEYGNVILECNQLLFDENDESSGAKDETFILILISGTENLSLEETKKYRMYAPYEIKTLFYKSKEVLCYYNVTRII